MRTPALLVLLAVAALPVTAASAYAHAARAQAPAGAPTGPQWAQMVTLSAQQRMLSQQMAAEYLYIAADVNAQPARESLAQDIGRFESTLEALRHGEPSIDLPGAPSDRVLKRLDEIQEQWTEFKTALNAVSQGAAPADADVVTVATISNHLLESMNKLVKQYERDGASFMGRDASESASVSLAAQQRTLAQQMAKEYMLVALGFNADRYRESLKSSLAQFEKNLVALSNGDATLHLSAVSDPAAKQSLDAASAQWKSFQTLVARATDASWQPNKSDMAQLATASRTLLDAASQVASRFDAMARPESALTEVESSK